MKYIFLFIPLFAVAVELPYFIHDKHGYLPKDKFSIGASKTLMNDTVDILNLKDSQLASSSSATGIGDMDGRELFARYNHKDDYLFGFKQNNISLSYGAGKLHNRYNELYIRTNFVSDIFAVDIGYSQNKADTIDRGDYKPTKNELKQNINEETLNSLLEGEQVDIVPNEVVQTPFGQTYTCGDGSSTHCIIWQDSEGATTVEPTDYTTVSEVIDSEIDTIVDIIDSQNIKFHTKISNLKDQSFFIRFIKSSINEIESFDTFLELKHTKIKSTLTTGALYEGKDYSLQKESLKRKENSLTFGINYSAYVNKWMLDTGYELSYTFRDKELQEYPFNHKIYMNIGYKIYKNTTLFIGANLFANQFNNNIPYLYNKYTQSSFDKRYGWVRSGLMISF